MHRQYCRQTSYNLAAYLLSLPLLFDSELTVGDFAAFLVRLWPWPSLLGLRSRCLGAFCHFDAWQYSRDPRLTMYCKSHNNDVHSDFDPPISASSHCQRSSRLKMFEGS